MRANPSLPPRQPNGADVSLRGRLRARSFMVLCGLAVFGLAVSDFGAATPAAAQSWWPFGGRVSANLRLASMCRACPPRTPPGQNCTDESCPAEVPSVLIARGTRSLYVLFVGEAGSRDVG